MHFLSIIAIIGIGIFQRHGGGIRQWSGVEYFHVYFPDFKSYSPEMIRAIYVIYVMNCLLKMIGRVLNLLELPWRVLTN